jgi:hypothetical protein
MSTSGGRVHHKSNHSSVKLSDKTVVQLRKMAGKAHVKQTRSDGSHKSKNQLIAGLRAAKHHHHGGASGGASGGAHHRQKKKKSARY